jgi:hypothetical protein
MVRRERTRPCDLVYSRRRQKGLHLLRDFRFSPPRDTSNWLSTSRGRGGFLLRPWCFPWGIEVLHFRFGCDPPNWGGAR